MCARAPRPEAPSSGELLDAPARAFFEPRFGHDFSRVRVHADIDAAASAKRESAQAYTLGRHIVFGHGRYDPGSPAGRRLLAHELAHVVQQHNASGIQGSAAAYEAEAGEAGLSIERGEAPVVSLSAPAAVQRQPLDEEGSPAFVRRFELGRRLDLAESASPRMAAVIGSVTLDGFTIGKADLSKGKQAALARTADTIRTLLNRYPASSIEIIGHTDAVGLEKDNDALGEARAVAVQAALVQMGIPAESIRMESHGARDLLKQTKNPDSHNRRVDVRFRPSRHLRGALSSGSNLGQPTTEPGKGSQEDWRNICKKRPDICGSPGGPLAPRPEAFQPIADDTPYDRMDVAGINEPYLSHGERPGADLRAAWRRLYRKYRYGWGLSETLAATAANHELSATAGSSLSRDNPNATDRLDERMKREFPDASNIGPFPIPYDWKF
jgi:outer membrane protein OmpA-like peptidoglycan-associated protein